MSPYDSLKFTHANLKRDVFIVRGQIVAYHYSDANKSNVVYAAGGAIFPVLESLEEIKIKLTAAEAAQKEA